MSEVSLHDWIITISRDAIEQQSTDGAMPAGHNGPYNDTETPVRNTAHWAVTFVKCFEWTGDQEFETAARASIEYLQSESATPCDNVFFNRITDKKDLANQLIGQAWALEAFAVAINSSLTFDEEVNNYAQSIFKTHPFDETLGLWKQLDIDGTPNGYCLTFNQQLWFAAIGLLLSKQNECIQHTITHFLDRLNDHMTTYRSGLIRHPLTTSFAVRNLAELPRAKHGRTLAYETAIRRLPWFSQQSVWRQQAIGYHSFNLYALALLYENMKTHPFWETQQFRLIWRFSRSEEFRKLVQSNQYAFDYNLTGIEMAYAINVFDGDRNAEQNWIERQFDRIPEQSTESFVSDPPDNRTVIARLYEATRLPNLQFNVERGRE